MDKKRGLIALLALLALLFVGLRGMDGERALGLDVDIGHERTRIVLTAAIVRLAFDFEHDRPKTDTRPGAFL